MRQISVVVPTRNAATTLGRCLASVRAQTGAEVEVIVVDNTSTDDTVAVARRYADQVIVGGPERSAQRNRGWRAASTPVIAFLDADMVADAALAGQALQILEREPALGALVVPEQSFGVGFLARCRALEKRLYLGDPAVEAARVFTRTTLDVTGGFDERLTAFEDWDLTDRVRAAGLAIGRVQARLWHDEGRVQLRRVFAKKAYYGRWLWEYHHRVDAPPARGMSRRAVVGIVPHLVAQPVVGAGLVLLKAVDAAGIASGALRARLSPGP
jgi:glycosyltransferase involved in cell wall biosynthesis